jgi:hypothetical protein
MTLIVATHDADIAACCEWTLLDATRHASAGLAGGGEDHRIDAAGGEAGDAGADVAA